MFYELVRSSSKSFRSDEIFDVRDALVNSSTINITVSQIDIVVMGYGICLLFPIVLVSLRSIHLYLYLYTYIIYVHWINIFTGYSTHTFHSIFDSKCNLL